MAYGDNGTVTGKSFIPVQVDTIATALPLPIVTAAQLADIKDPINIHHLSGKQEGAMVAVKQADGKLAPAIASGHLSADPWYVGAMADDNVVPA